LLNACVDAIVASSGTMTVSGSRSQKFYGRLDRQAAGPCRLSPGYGRAANRV